MTKTERNRLEAAGWRVGTVSDFLELESEESAHIELILSLAASLRRRRLALGWTQARLARTMGSSQSRVAKMEAGVSGTTADGLIRALLAAGCTFAEIGSCIAEIPQPPRPAPPSQALAPT